MHGDFGAVALGSMGRSSCTIIIEITMEVKTCWIQLAWSVFLVFSTVQFMSPAPQIPQHMSHAPLSVVSESPLEKKFLSPDTVEPEVPSTDTAEKQDVDDFVGQTSEMSPLEQTSQMSPLVPIKSEADKICLPRVRPSETIEMSLTEFWQKASTVSASYPPGVRQYVRLLALSLTGALTPAESRCGSTSSEGCSCKNRRSLDPVHRWCGNDWPPHGYTMVGLQRLKNVAEVLWQVISNKVPGDFAELGVWRGGTCIFAKSIMDVMNENRSVHLFDAFGTIAGYSNKANFLAVHQETVKNGFEMYNALDSKVWSNIYGQIISNNTK